MQDVEQAEQFAHFGASCLARKVFGVVGTMVPEHREDVQVMAEKGKDCPEYMELVRFLRLGDEVKDTQPDLPARAYASVVIEMGVEDTPRGPLLLVGGKQVIHPKHGEKEDGGTIAFHSPQ